LAGAIDKRVQRFLVALGLAIFAWSFVVLIHVQSSATARLIPKPHPLPPSLAHWQDATKSGDYFSQVRPTEVGYLVWSQFPVRVYIEQSEADSGVTVAQRWVRAVLEAVQEWAVYIPLEVVEQQEKADINILRSAPPLRASPTRNIPRVRSAETRYELYISNTSTTTRVLSHYCTILLSPSQTSQYVKAAARHEIGHALGIWGHSPVASDALYFSQVRNPPSISPRDINTLKRVYEQPTRLGWPLLPLLPQLSLAPYPNPPLLQNLGIKLFQMSDVAAKCIAL